MEQRRNYKESLQAKNEKLLRPAQSDVLIEEGSRKSSNLPNNNTQQQSGEVSSKAELKI